MTRLTTNSPGSEGETKTMMSPRFGIAIGDDFVHVAGLGSQTHAIDEEVIADQQGVHHGRGRNLKCLHAEGDDEQADDEHRSDGGDELRLVSLRCAVVSSLPVLSNFSFANLSSPDPAGVKAPGAASAASANRRAHERCGHAELKVYHPPHCRPQDHRHHRRVRPC